MIVYHINPIDFWEGWQKPSAVFSTDTFFPFRNPSYEVERWVKMWAKAQELAKKVGWEGDVSAGPFVSGIPDDSETAIIIGWKQDNNGSTFIATPFEMPWLKEVTYAYIKEGSAVVYV